MPTRQTEQEERVYQENPFKRGSMKFDDYNYEMYNPYILVEEDKRGRVKRPNQESQGID